MGKRFERDRDAWPHISGALRVDAAGNLDGDFIGWSWSTRDRLSPGECAAAFEEWADFYEYSLEQRADELAVDPCLRRLVAKWTDSMAYCCRRSAVWARGEHPGAWIPQFERRPDLYPVIHVLPDVDGDHDADRQLIAAGMGR